MLVPAAFVVWRTIRLGGDLGDVLSEVPAPLWRTIQLSVLVSTSTAVLGTGLAWLTTRTDLPGRRVWRIALVLPLVLPSFVGAAAFIAGLAPGGVLYDALTAVGITPPSRFRGLGASWLVLTAFTYPYVYLPVAARLLRLRSSLEESGRMLGLSSTATFFKVTLPQLRTAVFGGALLVFLYTLSEFGAVQLLGYDTLTRVIFASRQTNRALSFAAASVVLVLALGVVALERSQRGVSRPDDRASMLTRHPAHLRWGTVPALAACTLVLSVGLLVPVASLATWAQRGLADGRVGFGELVQPAMSTAIVAIAAAIAATVIVLPIALATTRRPHRSSDIARGLGRCRLRHPRPRARPRPRRPHPQHAGPRPAVPDHSPADPCVRDSLRKPSPREFGIRRARRAELVARIQSAPRAQSRAPLL